MSKNTLHYSIIYSSTAKCEYENIDLPRDSNYRLSLSASYNSESFDKCMIVYAPTVQLD